MSGYPQPPAGYGYGAPPPPPPHQQPGQPYAAPPQYGSQPSGYGAPPNHQHTSHTSHQSNPSAPPQYASPYAPSAPPSKPHKDSYGAPPPPPQSSYGAPYGAAGAFASLVPSAFAPGTDPSVVTCFQMADQDGSGLIDDRELQRALSSYNQSFSLRTVHLLMYLFTNSNARKIGPKEFTAVFYSLQSWRGIFDRFDRDRSGRIDMNELREALLSLGFSVSPTVLELLVAKFDKTGGHSKAIEYDNFIECCLTVKGLTDKFKEKDAAYSGTATFTYETFMLTVLPFLIA